MKLLVTFELSGVTLRTKLECNSTTKDVVSYNLLGKLSNSIKIKNIEELEAPLQDLSDKDIVNKFQEMFGMK